MMAAEMLLFLFLFRSKYRRKRTDLLYLLILIVISSNYIIQVVCDSCQNASCVHGVCENGNCICDKGWRGSNCQFCGGRVLITNDFGYISDGPGNYSVDIQCTWLIDAGRRNTTIRLTLEKFATECSWDHLYIHDGDSVFAPLVAVYSGVTGSHKNRSSVPEITTKSGFAFLHFYSDAAFNMTGFNISYRVDGCPKNCSNRGFCSRGKCDCESDWRGDACDIKKCPYIECKNGICDEESGTCICDSDYTGAYCDQQKFKGYWQPYPVNGQIPVGRTAHGVVLHNNDIWVVGGEYFNYSYYDNVIRYNFERNEWSKLQTFWKTPSQRYGHSLVLHKNKMYMYGGLSADGVIMNDLWKLEMSGVWEPITILVEANQCDRKRTCAPLAAVGHTATTVGDKMVVIFGHNSIYGYLNAVQEYYFESRVWLNVKTTGAIVKGGYGHTSIYDEPSKLIYVHGGYQSDTPTSYTLVDSLYSYNPFTKTWYILQPSGQPRFFHSAIILNNLMLVYGGNTHNGTSSHAKCFSADFMAYDLVCDTWKKLENPGNDSLAHTTRSGHSAIVYDGSMYVYGGFSGRMRQDFLKYTPGTCSAYSSSKSCIESSPGLKCVWHKINERCQPYKARMGDQFIKCPSKKSNKNLCSSISLCPTCLHNSYGCVWCGSYCAHKKCNKDIQLVKSIKECSPADSSRCDKFHNCFACHTEKYCGWHNDNKCYTFVREIGNRTEKAELTDEHRLKCDIPCSGRKTCQNCTQGQCLWCSSQKRCIDNNAYIVSFPFGQCRDWTNHAPKCPAASCSEIRSCKACQYNPMCGWCDDGSGTGLGVCLDGSSQGPVKKNGSDYKVAHKVCPISQWFYSSCPTCQCNGHSKCNTNNSTCIQPCSDLTEGTRCQHCVGGYFGNPINGGKCETCDCNNHATLCHRDTGKCYCTTKGITGHRCERCDESSKYYGNPKYGGSCFYNLTIDYQFTFNMSKPDDAHYTQINFKNTPSMPDVDVEFTITCSSNAIVNITVVSGNSNEKSVVEDKECKKYKHRLSHKEYLFGSDDNTTFYVYVYGFKTPMSVQVSFSQHRTLDLLQFFITFSCCFLSLLVIAAILWKIKQKYELYRRRQRLFVEMEHMASRPFSSVLVELDRPQPPDPPDDNPSASNKNKICPSPIALEPCYGHRAAVLSLLVRLPMRDQEFALPGQSGLAIASALVTLGSPQKNNLDSTKSESKSKNRKPLSPSHRDTCI